MADRLTVDLDGLSDFARRLRRIKKQLDAAKRELRGNDDELGDERVSSALEDFEKHWRDGREKVSENADALATMVKEAVKTYRSVDRKLGKQIAEFGDQFAPLAAPTARPSASVSVSAKSQ